MLERREAELREAMKLRHSLTTLLHALRVNMEHVSGRREPFNYKASAGQSLTLVIEPKRHSSNIK